MREIVTSDGVTLRASDAGTGPAVVLKPDGRAVVLENCGHPADLDQAEGFNSELLGFLAEL